jgi:DNA helicase HerA-like ATPase
MSDGDKFKIPDGPDTDSEGSTDSDTDAETTTDADAASDAPTTESVPEGESSSSDRDTDATATEPTAQSVASRTTALVEGEVGHVLGSKEIRIGRIDYTVEAYVTTTRREGVRVGDYVRVPYPATGESLFGAVDALRYEPYTELDDTTDTHNRIANDRALNESEYVLVAELEPIATISMDGQGEDEGDGTERTADTVGSADASTDPDPDPDDYERGIVNRIPKPDTTVSLAEDEAYLRTGLNIPHEGLFCGYLAVGGERKTVGDDPLPYYLSNPGSVSDGAGGYDVEDGEPAIWRHALVAGSTGKGKTHFTKNLLRQFIDGKRYPAGEQHKQLGVVILDPANEYWQMRNDNGDLDAEYIENLRDQGVNVGGLDDDLRVFVPEVANTVSPETGAKTPFSVPFSLVADQPQLLMPYKARPATRGAVEDSLAQYFGNYSRDEGGNADSSGRAPLTATADGDDSHPTYAGFIEFLDQNDYEDSPLREGQNIAAGSWNAMMRRVKRSEFRAVFDQDANRLTEYSHEMFRPGQVTVIPTRHLSQNKEDLVVLSILSFIIENKLKDYEADPNVSETPLLVAVDEAHNYLSTPSADDLRGQYIVGQARDAVKQGRKDQLGVMMITQNPEDIDDDILKQTNTNVFLGLRAEVVEKVPSIPQEFTRDIPKFGKGQAAVKAPDVEAVEVVGLEHCLTQHGDR